MGTFSAREWIALQRKSVPAAELKKYRQAKKQRAKVRRSLSQLKKQIRYLKGALRGKEEF